MTTPQCLCGRPYDAICRIAHLGQTTGQMKVFNMSLLTNDPEKNRELIKNRNFYMNDPTIHGPISAPLQNTQSYYDPPAPLPSAPSYNTIYEK